MNTLNEDGSITDMKTITKRDGSTTTYSPTLIHQALMSLTRPLANHRQYTTAAIHSALVSTTVRQHRQSGKSYSMGSSFGSMWSKYSVKNSFPFKLIINKEDETEFSDYFESDHFDRRMDAEKYILKETIRYYKRRLKASTKVSSNFYKRKDLRAGLNGDNQALRNFRVLLTQTEHKLIRIEEDHPEWMI